MQPARDGHAPGDDFRPEAGRGLQRPALATDPIGCAGCVSPCCGFRQAGPADRAPRQRRRLSGGHLHEPAQPDPRRPCLEPPLGVDLGTRERGRPRHGYGADRLDRDSRRLLRRPQPRRPRRRRPFGPHACKPGETKIYRFYAPAPEGTAPFLLYSTAADFATGSDAGQLTAGLFGSVVVEPEAGARVVPAARLTKKKTWNWPRSRTRPPSTATRWSITTRSIRRARRTRTCAPDPARGPKAPVPRQHARSSKMVTPATPGQRQAGRRDRPLRFDGDHHWPESGAVSRPGGPAEPRVPRRAPAFPRVFDPLPRLPLTSVQGVPGVHRPPRRPEQLEADHQALAAGQDNFAINYGMAGIGAEIWANRIKLGPMARSVESKFEEFFLSSWVVGDPAMIVDVPTPAGRMPARPDPSRSAASHATCPGGRVRRRGIASRRSQAGPPPDRRPRPRNARGRASASPRPGIGVAPGPARLSRPR